ncbi:hypothetical protein D7V97_11935 [Corallococcus sp. CA053C]|nr:hypothetical protein D7V97_11935 [Corallococcus sp. CA053C]
MCTARAWAEPPGVALAPARPLDCAPRPPPSASPAAARLRTAPPPSVRQARAASPRDSRRAPP